VPEAWREGKENNMAKSKSKNLAQFKSLDELVRFFDAHDLGEYWESMPEAQFEVDLESPRHLVSIDPRIATKLTRIARSKKTTSQGLVNSWLQEKIREQERKSI
jgi:hypothetical protein